MHYHIDACSVYRGILIVDGWCEFGAPKVLYKNEPVESTVILVSRPDVANLYGEQAETWGFKLCAFLSPPMRNGEELSLKFSDGEVITSPGSHLTVEENLNFDLMTHQLLAESKPGHRVLEIGSRARSGNTYRHLIHPEVDYVGIDIAEGPNVDVVGDAHHLSRHVTGQFDSVLSISVFEHLLMPWMVAIEMNKVLKLGGNAYIQSHQTWPLHDVPWDFWRFSQDAWEGLFNAHTGFEIIRKGQALRCRIIPESASMSHLSPGFDDQLSYMASACLIRKIGDATVSWDAEASEVYNLTYDHRQA